MNTKIQKWGNSLAVRLSKEVVQKQSLHEGSAVTVKEEKGRIVITAIKEKPTPVKLSDLLQKISSKNIHKEVSLGDESRGNEVW